MKEWLELVLAQISDGSLLPAAYYGGLNCGAALDARDGKAFAAEWIAQFEAVKGRWATAEVTDEVRALAEDVRRQAFLVVSRATRQHEIASYVSDDLDLIVRARLVGLRSSLSDRLWEVYQRGEFPVPPV